MNNAPYHNTRQQERGNALIIILAAVVIFAALSFTVSRSMNSSTTSTMSGREATIAASDILTYAQRMQRAIDHVRRKGCSESDINFFNTTVAGYTNTGAPGDNSCDIFHVSGGAMRWISPQAGINDASEWVISGANCLTDLGTGDGTCESDGATSTEELLLILPNVVDTVCTAITEKLDQGSTLANASAPTLTKFTGSFADGSEINLTDGPFDGGCLSNGGNNYFYKVLLAR